MRMNMKYNLDVYQFREKALIKIINIIKKQETVAPGSTLFFGDSLVEGIPDSFGVVANGISGISSAIMESLIDELVIKFNPKSVYFHIGTNDLGNTIMASPREIALNITRIMTILKRNLPDTQLTVISTLPCRDELESYRATGKGIRSNDMVQRLNEEIQDHIAHLGIDYLDLHSYLLNDDGSVKSSYYQDGLHLTAEGYEYLRQMMLQKNI